MRKINEIKLDNITTQSIENATTVTLGVEEYGYDDTELQEIVYARSDQRVLPAHVLTEILDKYEDQILERIWNLVTN